MHKVYCDFSAPFSNRSCVLWTHSPSADLRLFSTLLIAKTARRSISTLHHLAWLKGHLHSRKFSAERKNCKMWLADTNFPSGKKFWSWKFSTFYNNDIFGKCSVRGKFSWVQMGLNLRVRKLAASCFCNEWKRALFYTIKVSVITVEILHG
jgi:hypothetical protein